MKRISPIVIAAGAVLATAARVFAISRTDMTVGTLYHDTSLICNILYIAIEKCQVDVIVCRYFRIFAAEDLKQTNYASKTYTFEHYFLSRDWSLSRPSAVAPS